MRILKYDLEINNNRPQTLTINGLVQCVDVREQDGVLRLWALVYEGVGPRNISFRIIGTGHYVEGGMLNHWTHWRTVHMSNGLVWHIFVDYDHLVS